MLSIFEKGIVELIKCAFNGGTPVLDEGFELEKAYEFAQQRNTKTQSFEWGNTP